MVRAMGRAAAVFAAAAAVVAASLVAPSDAARAAPPHGGLSSGVAGSPLRFDDEGLKERFVALVRQRGYPSVEYHEVETDDNYVLGMFRIPCGRNQTKCETDGKQAVLLWHGLFDSSFAFAFNDYNESLSYVLADHGYDVWLPNSRGNFFSQKHAVYPTDSIEYWNFTWDDMAYQDLTTVIGYVCLAAETASIDYVGHSQGTTMMFAALSDPRSNFFVAPIINRFVALAPVAFVNDMSNPFFDAAAKWNVIRLIEAFDRKDFFPDEARLRAMLTGTCELLGRACESLFALLSGFHKGGHLPFDTLEAYGAIAPAGTSVKNVAHWSLNIRSGRFCKFDYGSPEENERHYGNATAPDYDLAEAMLPSKTLLVAGGKDNIADGQDVAALMRALRQAASRQKGDPSVELLPVPGYDHLDFTLADDTWQEVYRNVLAFLKEPESG